MVVLEAEVLAEDEVEGVGIVVDAVEDLEEEVEVGVDEVHLMKAHQQRFVVRLWIIFNSLSTIFF